MVLKTMQTAIFPSVVTISTPMFKKTACILISGRAGVGKSALATILKEEFTKHSLNVEKFSFASSLKEVAKVMYWDGKKDERGRKFLQDLGKVGRAYNKDLWCKNLIENVIPNRVGFPFDIITVDDWRFPNEYDFVTSNYLYHIFTVRIEASNREILKDSPAYNDVSETGLDDFNFDLVIDNTEDGLELLREKAQELIKMVLQTTPQM